jgi:3-oxoacyl-[acyl-carrier protein] reductase
MDLDLRDRVYLVTGGSRGLGRATAECLVAEGARVVISGRSEESLAAVRDALGEGCVTVAADNADPDSADRLVAAATGAWGRLDGALVSVGGPPPGTVGEVADEQWRAAFESVFLGALRVARQVATVLAPGGSIAFVLSSSAKSPIPALGISNGLRPGLAMAAKALADEYGPRGVRVNGLLPGSVATDRLTEIFGVASPDELPPPREVPLGRYGLPAEFGRVAAFVLSPAASFVSGAMVPVDGGALRAL